MLKAYWCSLRNQIHDPDKMKVYADLAGPAIKAGGGRFLARGGKIKSLEGFEQARVVIIEFPSFDAACDTYASAAYQAALEPVKAGAVTRDVFAVEGVEDLAPRGDTKGPVAFWIGAHMTVHDPDKIAAYAAKATEAMKVAGGRFLARAGRTHTFEGFEQTRVALAEHLSWDTAAGFYDSPEYATARKALDGGVTRDICITEAAEGV
ncbi:MAG: DUF1330 domain-containing protein [Rhodospirillaceae bacterium]